MLWGPEWPVVPGTLGKLDCPGWKSQFFHIQKSIQIWVVSSREDSWAQVLRRLRQSVDTLSHGPTYEGLYPLLAALSSQDMGAGCFWRSPSTFLRLSLGPGQVKTQAP